MTANQRRSGFRLPWVGDEEDPNGTSAPAASEPAEPSMPQPVSPQTNGTTAPAGNQPAPGSTSHAATAPAPVPASEAVTGTTAEPPNEFMRDLIGAMRKVAEEARDAGMTKLKADATEAVTSLEADAERRKQELRERADADVIGVGEWAAAEAERIKAEAEQRVAARRAQLEQQIAAEGTRTEAETKALRARVDDYERELEAFHAQLNEINDAAAFAAAAKRMPRPPELTPRAAPPAVPTPEAAEPAEATAATAPVAEATQTAPTPAPEPATEAVHPAEEEVLSARLADLDARLGDDAPATEAATAETAAEAAAPVASAEGSTTTDIVVKGLGSFGAITGFRQALSGQPGITGVALSLGQTGEFVFRATHAPGFDVSGAITAMEGDNATVDSRPEGGLRVSLERAR